MSLHRGHPPDPRSRQWYRCSSVIVIGRVMVVGIVRVYSNSSSIIAIARIVIVIVLVLVLVLVVVMMAVKSYYS